MNKLVVKEFKPGIFTVDSREVAMMISKDHAHLLRDIRGYIEILGQSNFGYSEFFIEDSYKNSQNKIQPCYQLTRKGCDMVANKMTGEKGVLFTAAYVTEFEEMKSKFKPMSAMELMELQFKVLKEQEEKIVQVENKVDKLEEDMPLFQVDCKEVQALVRKIATKVLGGYRSLAYNDNSVRGKVYSDIQHQIRREFGVSRYEAIKRSQLEKAIEIISNYRVPLVLENEIELLNNQIQFSN